VTLRPNPIDFRADALSPHALLSHSAAQLVDPERQLAALRLVHWYIPGWFFGVVLPAVALAYFWQSGNAAMTRDALRRRFGNENAVRFAFGAILGLIVRVAALLPSLYLYRVERAMSQSDQLLRAWSVDWLLVTLIWMLAVGFVTFAVLWLVGRTHQWYIYTILTILGASFVASYLAPFVSTPIFDVVAPLPARAVASVQAIEANAHLSIPVFEQIRKRSHIGTAYVIGLGPSQRIMIGDAIVTVTTPAELEYVVARQLGAIATGAQWKIALTDALLLIFGAAIAVGISDRIGFRGDDDPVSRFALVGAFFGLLYLVAVPIDYAVLRSISSEADRYALSLHVDRAAAVRNVVRATDQSLNEVCPDILAHLFVQRVEDASMRVYAINDIPSTCPR
jgi:Zn-dependent protease with chaperone function